MTSLELTPIPLRVTRYRCPLCPRSYSRRAATAEHTERCWYNPAARGCKTCKHFDRDWEDGETCLAGESLDGSDPCPNCGGFGSTVYGGGVSECGECGGDGGTNGPIRKPGPFVGCGEWEAKP